MKRAEVQLNHVYAVKVSGRIAPVRITADLGTTDAYFNSYQLRRPATKHRGWKGVNLDTNREVHIRTAAKLRREVAQ